MIRKLSSLSHKTLFIILVLLVAIGAVAYTRGSSNKVAKAQYPQYYNFPGNYVFSIPKTYSVDEQTIPGAQLVYSGQVAAKTLEDVYAAGGISVYANSDLTDHSAKAFKSYVNDKYLPELKKDLSVSDVKIKFGKANGADNASITVNKDGKALRFIYLKGGQHPAVVIAKTQTSAVSKIDETITDLETTPLKTEAESIKNAAQNIAQLAKDQKAAELYNISAPDLRAKNTQDELAKALQAAVSYTAGNIIITGSSYAPNEFSSAIRFTTLSKDNPQTSIGSMSLKKVDGQWKLVSLSLPTPKQ